MKMNLFLALFYVSVPLLAELYRVNA